jgi:hypothetical protein
MLEVIRRPLMAAALAIFAAGLLTFAILGVAGVDLRSSTEAQLVVTGEDGVSVCVQGVGASPAQVNAAEATVSAALEAVATDPRWPSITGPGGSLGGQVTPGCLSEPAALQPGVRVVDRAGKGFALTGLPVVNERDTSADLRIYVLTAEEMNRIFGDGNDPVLVTEAWLKEGGQATGVNPTLYVSVDRALDQALMTDSLYRATGRWEPVW